MKSGLFVLCIVCHGFLFSQKEIVSNSNAWVMYFGNHRLSDKFGIHTEYQWRRANVFEHWQQSLLRLGLDFYATPSLQLTAGYGWIRSYQYGEQPIAHELNEHRIWQQAITKSSIGRFDLQHRYRLEQRFIENWITNSSAEWELHGYNFRQRVRYRLLLTVPISRKEMKDNTLFLSFYDELFVGFGKGIGKNILDQNRLYGALGWRFNSQLNIQLGYLNQFVVKRDGIKAERNHTLQVGITYNLDLRKKK